MPARSSRHPPPGRGPRPARVAPTSRCRCRSIRARALAPRPVDRNSVSMPSTQKAMSGSVSTRVPSRSTSASSGMAMRVVTLPGRGRWLRAWHRWWRDNPRLRRWRIRRRRCRRPQRQFRRLLSTFTPPSISRRMSRPLASINVRAVRSFSNAPGMKLWAPNPD